jgi:hypothetical protein
MKLRGSAGWIDYLSAFLIPYIILMLVAGAENFTCALSLTVPNNVNFFCI